MNKIKFIYFDAANTLIHKPDLWNKMDEVFKKHNYILDINFLKRQHKLTSERIKFPDNTSKEFYNSFNKELLSSLGITVNEKILDDIFNICTYLPWRKFDDVDVLKEINIPLGIISNFNSTLKQKVNSIINIPFQEFIVSEDISIAKPDQRIFEYAIQKVNLKPSEILFIGDSILLDIEPSLNVGMNALLIDRDFVYPNFRDKITSLKELKNLI